MGGLYIPILLTIGLAMWLALHNEMWTECDTYHFLAEAFRSSTWIMFLVFPLLWAQQCPDRNFSISLGSGLKTTDGKAPASPWWTCTCEWEIYFYGLKPLHLGGDLLLHINFVYPYRYKQCKTVIKRMRSANCLASSHNPITIIHAIEIQFQKSDLWISQSECITS